MKTSIKLVAPLVIRSIFEAWRFIIHQVYSICFAKIGALLNHYKYTENLFFLAMGNGKCCISWIHSVAFPSGDSSQDILSFYCVPGTLLDSGSRVQDTDTKNKIDLKRPAI